jgi:hypothetical protein
MRPVLCTVAKRNGTQNASSTDVHPAAAAAAGFTAHPSAAVQAPGTYLGLIEKLDYLKALGVNAIELLPVSRHEVDVVGKYVTMQNLLPATSLFISALNFYCSSQELHQLPAAAHDHNTEAH